MKAMELITKKLEQQAKAGTQMSMPGHICRWCRCDDCAVMDGLCWYHYQEEHYLGK